MSKILAVAMISLFGLVLTQDAGAKGAKGDKSKGIKTVACDPACGFTISSHDENELVAMVQMHAADQHDKEMTDADVKEMMKEGKATKEEKKEVKMEVKKEEKD